MLCTLLLIRVATQNLSQEEFGLWSFVFGTVGYIMLLDFGVSYAIGRIFADSVYTKDHRALCGQLVLSFFILSFQALVILAIGLGARDAIISLFRISTDLVPEARSLWTWSIAIQSIALPFRVIPAVLHAQNRVYIHHCLAIVTAILNVLVFWWEILRGQGVMAYAHASAITTAILYFGYALFVFMGRDRVRFVRAAIPFSQLLGIFRYSFAVFASSLATQTTGAVQLMIVTRVLGLDAAAIIAVTAKLPALAVNLGVKPFESFRARWIAQYCSNQVSDFQREYPVLVRLTLLGFACAFIAGILITPVFVVNWTKPEYFGGVLLTGLLIVAISLSGFGIQLNIPFQMLQRMRLYTIMAVCGAAFEVLLCFALVSSIGLIGAPLSALVTSGGFVFLFNLIFGAALFQIDLWKVIRQDLGWWILALAAGGLSAYSIASVFSPNSVAFSVASIASALLLCLPFLYRWISVFHGSWINRHQPNTILY